MPIIPLLVVYIIEKAHGDNRGDKKENGKST